MNNLKEFIEKNQEKLIKVHWNDVVNEYTNNLIISKILLNKLSKEEYFEPLKDFFESINKNIENYVKNTINPSYQIAIVGAIKAGKSTLINTLIGHDLASVSVTPETATLTKFRYSQINYLKVKFYTTDEWKEIWQSAINKKAQAFLREFEELQAEEIKDNFLEKEELYVEYNSLEDMKEDIAKWTSSEAREHYFVRELEIGLSDLNLPSQICLVDTPGLNDVIDYRSKITRDYIDSANAVLICVNAKTMMRNEEMVTIAKVFSKARYKKDKIYVLGTQIDSYSYENWKKCKNLWVKYLNTKEYFENDDRAITHIIGISAHAYSTALELKDEISSRDVTKLSKLNILSDDESEDIRDMIINKLFTKEQAEELKEKAIRYSKITHIKDIIQKSLLKDYNKSLIEDYIQRYIILKDEIISFKEKHKEILENKKKQLEMTAQELNKEIEKEREKIRKVEIINKSLSQKIAEVNKEFNSNFSNLNKNFKELEKKIKNIKVD